MAKEVCRWCGEEKDSPPAVHDQYQCETTERLKGRKEIARLKQNLNEWKDAWFELREIIGKLWWYHPAIHDDKKREYYQNALK